MFLICQTPAIKEQPEHPRKVVNFEFDYVSPDKLKA